MDADPARHPSDQTLGAFGLGRLDDRSAGAVNDHLMECGDCRRRVAELSADSFLGRVRDARNGSDRSQSQTGGSRGGTRTHPPAPAAAETLPPGLADHPDYEIRRELGRGGMGVVYLAENKLMGRLEVLKVVGGHLVNRPGVLDRFLREIRSAAKLQHPNIVTAYSAMRLGEGVVLAMEFVDGLDLSRMVRTKGPLPVGHACYFIHQVALGLQHAHERGMVHRDIKPANLILTREGKKTVVKVLDFGLAKLTSEGQGDGGLTREGQMLGTPDYIAPEQIRDAQSADIRADIYSLGCTFYYLLTGGPPFRAANLWDLYQAHFSMDADPLNLVRPEVPAELAALVAKMMAKEPERRFQTPGAVARELTRFFKPAASMSPGTGPPHVAPPSNPTEVSVTDPAPAPTPVPIPAPPQSPPTRRLVTIPPDARPAKPGADGVSWESLIEFKETEPAPEAEKSKPTPAESTDRRPPWRSRPVLAVAAASLAGLFALGIIIHVTTDKGRTTITVDEKTGEVRVKKEPLPDPPVPSVEGQSPVEGQLGEVRQVRQADWVPLFNRKDLTGWTTHPSQPAGWRVEDGLLIGSGPRSAFASHLYTEREDYRDFHLRVVARINGGGNSGVFFRASYGPFWPGDNPRFPLGYEAQINSTHPDRHKTGSLLHAGPGTTLVSVTEAQHFPDGWFTLEVIARGNHFIIKVNGKTTADYTDTNYIDTERQSPGGRIALQQLGPETVVAFRTVEIQELNGTDDDPSGLSGLANQFLDLSLFGKPSAPPAAAVSPEPPASADRLDRIVLVSAKKEHGHVIGKLGKGEKLVLQYQSGKWKGWGDFATASPDEGSIEGGDRCRLAIGEATGQGRSRVLAVVPAGTEERPFEWTADRDYENLILRINDNDNDFASNPDSGVSYRLRITSPTAVGTGDSPALANESEGSLAGKPVPSRGEVPGQGPSRLSRLNSRQLFNGRDFNNWYALCDGREVEPDTIMRIENGELIHDSSHKMGYLQTNASFSNFIISLQYKFPANGRSSDRGSGVCLIPESLPRTVADGLECELATNESGRFCCVTGAFFDSPPRMWVGGPFSFVSTLEDTQRPTGEWNDLRIRCQGRIVEVELNGKEINRVECKEPIKVRIGLQDLGTDSHFRNIFIAPVPTTAMRPGVRRSAPRRPADAREFLGKSYKVFPQQLTWHEARAKCRELGGHLAIVTSEPVNRFLTSLVEGQGLGGAWLGATDEQSEGRWTWVDGTPLRYSNWYVAGQQPNNKQGIEHYMALLTRFDGTWCDQPDDGRQEHPGFVCEWD